MADNGHCSTCQTHNITSECGSNIESFKNLFGSSVENNESYLKINSIMPNITANSTLITKDTWDQIKTILQAIKDYGELAEENPTQDKINAIGVSTGNIAFLNDYNKILTALDKGELSGTQLISKDLIDSLKTNIQKYNINDARCNVCNISYQNSRSPYEIGSGSGTDDGGCYCGGTACSTGQCLGWDAPCGGGEYGGCSRTQ